MVSWGSTIQFYCRLSRRIVLFTVDFFTLPKTSQRNSNKNTVHSFSPSVKNLPFLDTSNSTKFSKFWMSGGNLWISLSLKPSFRRRCSRKKLCKLKRRNTAVNKRIPNLLRIITRSQQQTPFQPKVLSAKGNYCGYGHIKFQDLNFVYSYVIRKHHLQFSCCRLLPPSHRLNATQSTLPISIRLTYLPNHIN